MKIKSLQILISTVRHKIILALSLFLVLSFGHNSSEYTYVYFNTGVISMKYMREGILCSGIYKGNYFCRFYKSNEIPFPKKNAIQNFIKKERIWELPSSLSNDKLVLGATSIRFALFNAYETEYKEIVVHSCYHPKIDSLIVYLNDLLPKSELKRMNLLDYRVMQSNLFPDCK